MKAERLSDALSFLDDDIIEETQALRDKKRNYKSIWIKVLSVAACLCIALTAVIGSVGHCELPLRGSDINATLAEEYKYGSGDWLGGFSYAAGSMTPFNNAVYLEITEWKRTYFYAMVLEGQNDDFSNGTRVKVKFDKNIYVGLSSGQESGELYYEHRRPTQEDFSVGSKLYVVFNKSRNSFLNSKADKVINALSIKAVKSSEPLRGPGSMMTYYYVEITEWGKKEFEGIIKGSKESSGELPLDKEVTVKFDNNITVKKDGKKAENRIPTEADFPVGSRVEVLLNDNNAPEFLSESEILIYSIGDIRTLQTVLVRIDEWNSGGFTGTLCGENGTLALHYTSHVTTVEFTENTRTETKINDATTRITLAPTEEDFPVGTIVEVSYKDFVKISAEERIYIADRIWLYE